MCSTGATALGVLLPNIGIAAESQQGTTEEGSFEWSTPELTFEYGIFNWEIAPKVPAADRIGANRSVVDRFVRGGNGDPVHRGGPSRSWHETSRRSARSEAPFQREARGSDSQGAAAHLESR